jgi:hypothetical protein
VNRLKIVFIALLVILAALVAIALYPSGDDFRPGNRTWNGISTLVSTVDATAIDSLSDLPSRSEGTVFIIVPYMSFNTMELNDISDYVFDGGTLILLDDYGHGNEILDVLGVDYRFSDAPLLDPLVNYKNERFPKILTFEDLALTSGIDALVFDHSSCLIDVPVGQIIAQSSSFSFLDTNDNSLYDNPAELSEQKGPFPVIAYTILGEGRLVAVSDPSIVINGMIDMEDNLKIIENAAILAASTPNIYIDQSHIPDSAMSRAKSQIDSVRSVVAHPLMFFGMAGGVLFLTFRPLWRKRR